MHLHFKCSQLASKRGQRKCLLWRHFLFRLPCLARRISWRTLSVNRCLHSSSSFLPVISPSSCDLESFRFLSETISLFTESFSTRSFVKLSNWLVYTSVNFLQNREESDCRKEALTGPDTSLSNLVGVLTGLNKLPSNLVDEKKATNVLGACHLLTVLSLFRTYSPEL